MATDKVKPVAKKTQVGSVPETAIRRTPLVAIPCQENVPFRTARSSSNLMPRLDIVNDALFTFLKDQHSLLKGSPEAFHQWLHDAQDILTLDNLADAAMDDDYLNDVLRKGDGKAGVKGYKLGIFKNEVSCAAIVNSHASGAHDNKENAQQPPSELICPLSKVHMTNEPMTAADGHTYELTEAQTVVSNRRELFAKLS